TIADAQDTQSITGTIASHIPVDTDDNLIEWDNLLGTIEGTLFEVAEWCERTGYKRSFLKHRAITSGKVTIVDSTDSIAFLRGDRLDPRDFDDPAPPTPQRVTEYDARSRTAFAAPAYDASVLKDYAVNTLRIDEEDADWLATLKLVFGKCERAKAILKKAKGSGTAFRLLLIAEGQKAKPDELALIAGRFDAVKSRRFTELTLEAFQAWITDYRKAKGRLPRGERPRPAAEVQMVNRAALAEPTLRRLYAVDLKLTPPSTLDEAVDLVLETLRSDANYEEMDAVAAGEAPAATPALSAAGTRRAAPAATQQPQQQPAPAQQPQPDATATAIAALTKAVTAALAAQGVADPNRGTGQPGKTKAQKQAEKDAKSAKKRAEKKAEQDASREAKRAELRRLGAIDAEGKLVKWVTGMGPCRHCGGSHLNRDCSGTAGVTDGDADAGELARLEALAAQLNALTAPGGTLHNLVGVVESLDSSAPPSPSPATAPSSSSGATPAWLAAGTCDCDACGSGLAIPCELDDDAWCAPAAALDRSPRDPARVPSPAAPPTLMPRVPPPADTAAGATGPALDGDQPPGGRDPLRPPAGGGEEHERTGSERGAGTCAGPSECVSGGGVACPCLRSTSPVIKISTHEIEISSPEITSPEIAISSAEISSPEISPDFNLLQRSVMPIVTSPVADELAVRSAEPSNGESASPSAREQAHASDMRPRVSAPVFLESHPGGVAARSHEVAPDRDLAPGTRDSSIGSISNAAAYADMACLRPARVMPACRMMGAPTDAMGAPEDASTSSSREREHAQQVKDDSLVDLSLAFPPLSLPASMQPALEPSPKPLPRPESEPTEQLSAPSGVPSRRLRAPLSAAQLKDASEPLSTAQLEPANALIVPPAKARPPATTAAVKSSRLLEFLLMGHPDSGCTGSMTPDRSHLINIKPWSEPFRNASGVIAKASCIGDLPVYVLDNKGNRHLIIFNNVRCVPEFTYTLLSVKQLWREQRIDARFADVEALVLSRASGGHKLPFVADKQLPTLLMLSAVKLAAASKPRPALAAAPVATSATKSLAENPRRRVQWASELRSDVRLFEKDPAMVRLQRDTKRAIDLRRVIARGVTTLRSKLAAATALAGEVQPSPSATVGAPSPSLLPTPRASPSPSPPVQHAELSSPKAASVAPEPTTRANLGRSSLPLGFHAVGSTSHVSKLPAAQAAQLMQRRSHMGVNKLRALPHTTSDAPDVLASAPVLPVTLADAQARIKRSKHSSTLKAPDPEPGKLHVDLKEMVLSVNGFRYIVFLIDEHSRYVFFDFIKVKSEAMAAVQRCIAAFNATVGTRVDEDGRALARPTVRLVHSDREGKLMSHAFRDFRASGSLHHTTSPPHDHDLNPIAERIIGLISETATAIRVASNASPRLWPWIIAYAVDWHNASTTAVGSSTADANISPAQRFTLQLPRVMDLPAFGCRAVVLKPPQHQHKPSLSGRGWVGSFLGRSRDSRGSYDVLVGGKVVTSSSVLVDEEHFDWQLPELRHQPLTSLTHMPSAPQPSSLLPPQPPPPSDVSARATYQKKLVLLNLFSGPYARSNGLTAKMRAAGWEVEQVDNDGERGGGWQHDLLNDSFFARLLERARAGEFQALMIAFPCGTFAVARFFDATDGKGGGRGPPVIRDFDHPDGLPEDEIDPKHIRELRLSNELLTRTVALAIAARQSPAKTSIIVENPADRSPGASMASAPEFAKHGSLFRTSPFLRLAAEAELDSHVTFAYCRLKSDYQKYTTLYFTPECGSILDELGGADYQCNHPRGSHTKQAGGRLPNGGFASAAAAAYPELLCEFLARAFTVAR
ncbi:hypothetical protein OAO87_02415, partial [bacterium]|nr:hypothetical protein [bacterium]